jgi:hypothetical protein
VVGLVDFGTSAYNGFTRINANVIGEIDGLIAADAAGVTLTASQELGDYYGITLPSGFGGFGFDGGFGHYGFA